ncbi:MAG: heme biosynthesis HemY N-terminal domain-containing protein [Sulfuritalea sp.]|nr:heme biosynthesis HemY N-terminal domain-containing protein [Sulfuritalea sp.]
MRAVFWLLVLAALAVGLALAARYNEGYVLLVLPPWRAEVSLNLFLLLCTVGFFVIYLLARAVSHTLALPRAVAEFRRRRRQEKAALALRDAWRLLQEGRYGHAMRCAEKARPDDAASGMLALAGWRAAHALRDTGRETEWAARLRGHDSAGLQAARLMTEAEFALEERRFDDARDALHRFAAREGRHIAAMRLSLRAEQGLGNWREVARLVRQLEKHQALTAEQAAPIRSRAVREALRSLREDPAGLMRYWRELDDGDRAEPSLALETARALMAAGDCREAQRVIEDALDERWDAGLVLAYGECGATGEPVGDVLGRIAQAEKWLQSVPRDGALLLTLGRLCRRQQLWGKARSYLEAALAIAPSRVAHVELAQLLDQLEESALAARHYRAAAVL